MFLKLSFSLFEKSKNATDFLFLFTPVFLGNPGGIISFLLVWKTMSQSSNSKYDEGYILNNVVIFFSWFNSLSV